jgi:hypothetical protein
MASFVLVPGAGGMAWYWHRVVPLIHAAGHAAIAVDLPGDDRHASLAAYAEIVARAIAERRDPQVVIEYQPEFGLLATGELHRYCHDPAADRQGQGAGQLVISPIRLKEKREPRRPAAFFRASAAPVASHHAPAISPGFGIIALTNTSIRTGACRQTSGALPSLSRATRREHEWECRASVVLVAQSLAGFTAVPPGSPRSIGAIYATEFDLATYFLHDVPEDVLRAGPPLETAEFAENNLGFLARLRGGGNSRRPSAGAVKSGRAY